MRAGKAYISSLGTTGLLVTSSLLLLAVVSALIAFDAWPQRADAEGEVVAIAAPSSERDEGTRHAPDTREAAEAARAAGAASAGTSVRSAAISAGRVQARPGSSQSTGRPADDPVVSGLTAPDAAPGSASSSASPPQAPAPVDSGAAPVPALPTVGDVVDALPGGSPTTGTAPLAETTGQVGEALDPVSPVVGDTVADTGTAVEGTVTGVVETTVGP